MNGLQKLLKPLRRERHRRQERKRGRDRESRPLSKALPPGPVKLFQNRKYLRTAHGNKRNDRRSMTQRYLDVLITTELAELIGVAIQHECAPNTFREKTKHLFAFEHVSRILLTRDDAAELGHVVKEKRKLDKPWVNQKARITADPLREDMQGHHAIPWHEAAMKTNQDRSPMAWNMIEPVNFDAPVVIV